MKRLHVIGRKNHGKTTLVVELLEEFGKRGLRVGSVKHTHHDHQLDVPGKDSHRHQQAGAAVVGVLSRSMSALFVPTPPDSTPEDRYAVLAPAFEGCDLVLVEGDVETTAPKIEVWRASESSTPLVVDHPNILAVVSDDPLPIEAITLARTDVARLADWIQEQLST